MYRKQTLMFIWFACLLLAAVMIVFLMDKPPQVLSIPNWIFAGFLLVISAFCEYLDSSLGMGYGTTLTPLLLTLGVIRQEIVPAILLSELLTGFFSGIAHHREGNVNLRDNKNIWVALPYLAIPAVIGVVVATVMSDQLKEQGQRYANLYIGLMIISIGIYLTYKNLFGKPVVKRVSKFRLFILGTVAAFNKGVSGGGYGPLMMGGQVVSGIKEKEAIVITSFCECFTCFVGLVVFFALGGKLNLSYTIPLCIGSLLTVIPAAKTVKILPEGVLKKGIGWATILLGMLTLWKFLS